MSTPCSAQMCAKPITSSLEDLDGSDLDVFYALVIRSIGRSKPTKLRRQDFRGIQSS